MKIQRELGAGQNVIRSYGRVQIIVNQDTFTTSLIVTPEHIVRDWRPRAFAELTAEDFDAVVALGPEVILLGTGAHLRFPDPSLMRTLVAANIGFEVMDTGAACRTYNVLMTEGRRVAAALLPIE